MKLRFLNRPALTISLQLAAATSVLGICLFYAISAGFVVPYPGLVIGPDWIVASVPPCTARAEWCGRNAGKILIGDQILSIGSLTHQEFIDQRTTPPFWGYAVGETATLRILRNGRERTVNWVLLGPTAQQRASRLSGILIFLPSSSID